MRWTFAACAALAVVGCQSRTRTLYPVCTGTVPGPDAGVSGPLFFPDVQPIVDAHCASCHTDGGLGPFPLTSYDDVVANSGLIKGDVTARVMPPWLPDKCCQTFLHDPSLSDDQIATVARWIDEGMQEGDPGNVVTVTPDPGMSRVDATLQMPSPYTPQKIDEQRCFVLDWPETTTKFVTGINLVPGNRSIVHHVIVYVVDNSSTGTARGMEGKDGQPGFDCTGGLTGLTIFGALGGWQPNSGGLDYPDGLGTRVAPGSAIVLNVHYNLSHGGTGSDQTTLQVELADSVQNEMLGLAVSDPLWLINNGMSVPAGATDSVWATEMDPTPIYGGGSSILLYNAMIHMHAFATRGLITVQHPDGTSDCLVQVTRWSLGWNGTFWFSQPFQINRGDKIHVECHFANPTQQALDWSNTGEMCAAFGSITVLNK